MTDLGKYFKTPDERRRYSIDYTDWLDTDEEITAMTFTVTPSGELEIDAYSIATDGLSVGFFAADGEDGGDYTINVKASTSGGQLKEDEILFEVRSL